MDCRPGCGACCIAPSITRPLPGMPDGKPAGVPCIHLNASLGCRLWGSAERPTFCAGLRPSAEMCGTTREQALLTLADLEVRTRPAQDAQCPGVVKDLQADS